MECTVALTIAPLCELASNIWDTLHEMDHLMDRAQDKLRNLYNATLSSCEDRMCRAGWCRNTVSHDFMSTLWGLRIVSNLVRLPPYIRKSPDEHKSCDESHCVFYKIDTTTYIPRHVEPSCACAYIKPSFEDVVHLLEEGFVPVVVYDGTQLRVQPASAGPYVAISHVWADGMGSTTVDGLPGCVVKRIASLARRLLPESGAFWMDSLCIPDTGNLRTKAIKLMAQTYRDATSVLVLDDCIRAQCSEDKSWEENLFRIAASGWVRRVWTLQEGLLARELYFEFADGPVNVEQRLKLLMAQSTDADRPDSFEYLNPRSCSSHVSVLDYRLRHGPNQTSHNVPLDSVIRLLRLRSTTKPEDELIAIHSLIPFNVDALLKIKGKDAAQRRIRAFLLEQGTVSKELPTQLTPRMSLPEPGFSWAPRTLVSAIEGAGLDSGTGKCTPDGLVAEYNIAAFDEPVQIPTEYMTDPKPSFLRILITQRGTRTTYMLRLYVALGNQGATSFDGLAFCDADVDSAGSSLQGPKSRCFAVSGARELRRPLTRKGPLNYVAPGRILRMALQSDRFRPEDLSVMGNLEKYLVQLV